MSKIGNLEDTLKVTITRLKALRKTVADAGRIQDMQDIDTLLHLAQIEAERQLTALES